ncbi:MAG: ribonuclease PH [Candidatus Melainabacteria bacterium]
MVSRPDGRRADELRPLTIERGFTMHAPGAILVSFGNTKVIVTAMIEERVPRHIYQNDCDTHGWLTAEYSMLPGATNTRTQRDRQKISGRTTEIQRLIGRCLRASIDLEKLGARTITIDADVIQADGGTRVAAITGGFVAMADAVAHLVKEGLLSAPPAMNPIAAVSVGIVNGEPVLDLNYAEDSTADVDANIVMSKTGQIIEFQASTEKNAFDRATMTRMMDLAESGIQQIVRAQEEALGLLASA